MRCCDLIGPHDTCTAHEDVLLANPSAGGGSSPEYGSFLILQKSHHGWQLKWNPSETELPHIPGDASPCQDLVISLDNSEITTSNTAHNLEVVLDNQLSLLPSMQVSPELHQKDNSTPEAAQVLFSHLLTQHRPIVSTERMA
ncbi:hypothetical protein AMELA_G00176490 [Ameiurus melas]|uniref:Uncharacterized protein n=1 Tax=Ameiurus melas TaxID=219545 RepID=A0A7J6ADI3_AMEME|nr:hypothetical protein AMELA_G00176490 [Ameiurus melas]